MKRIIDLTWRVDLQTADKAKENLEKAKGGHLGTHFDVMNKEFPLELRFSMAKSLLILQQAPIP